MTQQSRHTTLGNRTELQQTNFLPSVSLSLSLHNRPPLPTPLEKKQSMKWNYKELENFLRGEEEKCPYVCFGNKEIITLSFQWLLLRQTLLYFIRTRRDFPAPSLLDLIHWATVAPDRPPRFVDSGIRAPSTAHYIKCRFLDSAYLKHYLLLPKIILDREGAVVWY